MFSNIDRFRIFVPKIFCSGSEFLSYLFKCIMVNGIRHVNLPYPSSKFIDKFLFFFTILDNSQLSFLNKFFFNDDRY